MIKQNILFVFIIIVFCGCESLLIKDLPVEDFDFEKRMVISGYLDPESENFFVMLAENQSILSEEDETIFIIDGAVSLLSNGNEIATLENQNDGFYLLEDMTLIQPLIGQEVELKVDHPTFGITTAKTTIPSPVEITDLEFKEEIGIFGELGELADGIQFNIPDEAGKENYYGVRMFHEDGEVWVGLFEQTGLTEEGVNYLLLSDRTFDGQNFTIQFIADTYMDLTDILDEMRFEFITLSEEQYNFEKSLRLYYNSQGFGLFQEPVTLFSNVDNGVGIFAGKSSKIYGF